MPCGRTSHGSHRPYLLGVGQPLPAQRRKANRARALWAWQEELLCRSYLLA